ncbi:MAG: FMN-binding protein [Chloroflexota bacterium]
MSKAQPPRSSNFVQPLKQFVVSAFVVFTFAVYAVHDRLNGSDGSDSLNVAAPPTLSSETKQATALPSTTPSAALASRNVPATPIPPTARTVMVPPPKAVESSPTVLPTIVEPTIVPPSPTVVVQSGYKDGQYIGDVTDAYYGNVQVKAIIQGGTIMDVQFLQYPRDRRTSARINSYAAPALRTEALQAQNAQVDIISGATLTSEAFAQSLQSALNKARA